MRLDGYVCENCLAYAPRNYRERAGTLPDGWVEMSRYSGLGSPRNLHWCSEACRDTTITIRPAQEMRLEILTRIQEAVE